MDVRYRLACRPADVDAHIVTVRAEVAIENCFDFVNQFPDCRFLSRRRLKVVSYVPPGNDQAMTLTDRVGVKVGKRQLGFDHFFGVAAKGATLGI